MTLDSFQMIIHQNNVELISSYNIGVTIVIHIAIFCMQVYNDAPITINFILD